MVTGQLNLRDAVNRSITFQSGTKRYELRTDAPLATLMVRPRGWHLPEAHVQVDGDVMSASLFDFGLYFFHNAKNLVQRGSGPYFYLPKMESHREARLWNDVFVYSQQRLAIPQGTIRATVLIETILAAFEMEEIIYELRDHSAGLSQPYTHPTAIHQPPAKQVAIDRLAVEYACSHWLCVLVCGCSRQTAAAGITSSRTSR